ncbi:GTPase ObgE [Candidatus Karelsulcia muelleri]|uniref:GTPase ObgE n=1 Tax=Candidatus Karelsulcia muelleri TaxID=336810 RepID=UPI000D7BED1A|nr:GTPase ObgE [Candidatus Karelsulcia muelleri]
MINKFLDYIKIYCRSGNGGSGMIHFKKNKTFSKGGPDGGDGGKGGNVIIRGNNQLYTISHLKKKKHNIAENGKNGGVNRITGSKGKNYIIEVPIGTIGTIVKDEKKQIIFEILNKDEEKILLYGGKGGKGNWNFKNYKSPFYSEKGKLGKEAIFILELKILADVGIIGFPNSGKSTLISVITSSKSKISNYPFTTLIPNLGIAKKFHNMIIADIPGIIKGASQGKGLGFKFLKHIQRNIILLIMISAETKNYIKEYNIIINELSEYDPYLLKKKRLLIISKSDLLDEKLKNEIKKELPKNEKFIFFSSFQKDNFFSFKKKFY